ncbi:MAG: R3H domain-containing nucleic acid-binding protein [Oscillatoria sp. PMC 1051.18]|nr:R3H domain-containing nucleic acid-binding protein [Oscillatoria sp. PMC 1050.18]MEC5031761.1 R3H domain-containing nucleic acid-binding protein [Oscillatoria sp. PMC 1051.18]
MDRIEQGLLWLEELLALMNLPAKVKASERTGWGESTSGWLTIDETDLTPEQIAIAIGSQGETIDAMQYLANTLLNIGLEREEQKAFTIELNGYRLQREAELKARVEIVAQKVRETGKEAEISSLSAAERRQVHHFFKSVEDLSTYSRGQEPDRRLVVRLRE